MAKLLVIDSLDLALRSEDGFVDWSSRSCFEVCLRELDGLICEYTSALNAELCRLALASDGVILGGYYASAWEDSVFNDRLLDTIAICRNNGIPLLGVCFGAQLLGRALGGHVDRHPGGMELGALPIRISGKGREHFLFEGIERGSIKSVETHRDAVMTLPPDCELLASTAHTPVQAFSFQDLLCGVQFHPEMNGNDLRQLWKAFEMKGLGGEITGEDRLKIEEAECDRVIPILQNFARRVRSGRVSHLTTER